ncbi:hypothetical protein [Spiroplasma poulsonii]|uniref:hypothetical protein n=1 Tax=Spiroplasma poulsonii TaxID=2138 RepID=UPI001F4CC672|nr:hypothetical protein [Spiroplasma poulsonii]UNF61949.1 hypothetical protein MNU24_00310 [Spiroplasma poulsonii]
MRRLLSQYCDWRYFGSKFRLTPAGKSYTDNDYFNDKTDAVLRSTFKKIKLPYSLVKENNTTKHK